MTKINRYASVVQDSAKWYEDTLAGSKISYLYLDHGEIKNLEVDLLFEYATTIEHLKSISDDDFETLKDTIIKVDLVS